MTNLFYAEKPITDFEKLGTGRKRKKVVVVTEDGRILFIARVRRNHPSCGEIEFDNRKTFYLNSQNLGGKHVGGKKVHLFLWSEVLEDSWCKQCEVDVIERWMKSSAPNDIFAFVDCVGLERGIVIRTYQSEILSEYAKSQIRQHLRFLSLVELRRLTAMLEASDSTRMTPSASTLPLAL